MRAKLRTSICAIPIALLLAYSAEATSVPALSFEELSDHSELIVAGEVMRSWSAWDADHKMIWTHHELRVSSSQKGAASSTVVVSEPGGVVGNSGMAVAGAVAYRPGDQVVAFLERMPNGYLRTTGWGQGKYTVDKAGMLHAEASLHGLEVVGVNRGANSGNPPGTSLRSLDGVTVNELRVRIAARIAARQRNTK